MNSDKETDYDDQMNDLSESSSEDEMSERNTGHLHQAQHEPMTEDKLRELRIALEKVLAQKKALQARVRQLQKDRVRYLKYAFRFTFHFLFTRQARLSTPPSFHSRKMDSGAGHVNALNRSVVEAESKWKRLE